MDIADLAIVAGIITFGGLQYTMMFHALRDLRRRRSVRGGNKMNWAILIVCLPILGPLCYEWIGPTIKLAGSDRRRHAVYTPMSLSSSIQQPSNITPIRPVRSSAVRGRTTAHRSGLTRSRAHHTVAPEYGNARRPGA